MARIARTVKELAREAGADLDEVLVTMWDLGLGNVMSPDDLIPRRFIKKARFALGVASRNEFRSLEYWRTLLGLSDAELEALLHELGFEFSCQNRRIPRGAISKLKVEARGRGIDPATGKIKIFRSVSAQLETGNQSDLVRQIATSFVWRTPGHERSIRWLTEDEVIGIHLALVKDFATSEDPMQPPGLRSEHLLASAVFRPQTSLGGVLKYSTIETSAAALLHSIIQDHPFYNGNKRTALVSMLVMLDENGLMLTCNQNELFKLVLQVAQHRITEVHPDNLADREVLAITDWICGRCRVVEKGERPIPWRRLRRILRAYGCRTDYAHGTGRINIARDKTERNFFGFDKTITLRTQVFYGDEGRDVEVDTIKKIRDDLALDDAHGIDSFKFYNNEPTQAGDFIVEYRKTLRRLAKL